MPNGFYFSETQIEKNCAKPYRSGICKFTRNQIAEKHMPFKLIQTLVRRIYHPIY